MGADQSRKALKAAQQLLGLAISLHKTATTLPFCSFISGLTDPRPLFLLTPTPRKALAPN